MAKIRLTCSSRGRSLLTNLRDRRKRTRKASERALSPTILPQNRKTITLGHKFRVLHPPSTCSKLRLRSRGPDLRRLIHHNRLTFLLPQLASQMLSLLSIQTLHIKRGLRHPLWSLSQLFSPVTVTLTPCNRYSINLGLWRKCGN